MAAKDVFFGDEARARLPELPHRVGRVPHPVHPGVLADREGGELHCDATAPSRATK